MTAPPKTFGPPKMKKSATDYGAVAIQSPSPARSFEPGPQDQETPRSRRPGYTRPVLDRSKAVMLYLDPEGVKAVEKYRVELPGCPRMHDLYIEAIEEWAARRGIRANFRVTPLRTRRTYGDN